ncbi:MAG: glycosyltransferase [Clostridia bacterium]|nr:glycosyltransferase [Clostridia bacterium]MBR3255741.1 glycosyltransferase [Clostridia bacterium]
MNDDLVDILLATYNSNENFLREQIDSLLNQTHKNIKIYISDDASTEKNVGQVLKEYEEKDDRVIIFMQEKNIGFNSNFEFLLKQSTADYIMFCDHDDVWHNDKVEKSLIKIKETNSSLVYVNCRQIDENGNVICTDYFKHKNIPLIKGKSKLAISRYAGIGCSQIITKEVKEKMIPFKTDVIAHDWLAGFIANELNGIDYIYDELFDYRLHTSNVFGGRSLNQNLARWKEKYGNNYDTFRKYRKWAIENCYLDAAKMCFDYAENNEDKLLCKQLIAYYEMISKTRIMNIHFIRYFKLLGGKNLIKKMCKEIVLFHLPFIAFLAFKIN